MGFDIFLSVVTEDEADQFDRSIVERAFRPIVVDLEGDVWELRWPNGALSHAEVAVGTTPTLDGIHVSRPPGMPAFWQAIYEILRQTRTVLLWPGDPCSCVANPDLAANMPADYVEDRGQPVFVTSGQEIVDAISRSD